MVSKIFVNLPVKDLDKSIDFFKAIGFSFNPQFTDKTAACMVMSDDIYAMLLTHDKAKEFTKKPIADAHKTTELLTALAVESKAKVNELADKALKAGAKEAYLGSVLDGSGPGAEDITPIHSTLRSNGRNHVSPRHPTSPCAPGDNNGKRSHGSIQSLHVRHEGLEI
jgi:uncharacterized protein